MALFRFIPCKFLLPLLLAVATILTANIPTGTPFSRLQALEGIWKMETRRGPLFEQWQKFDENTMHGISYRISGIDTLLLERVELLSRSEGIFYIPTAINQNDGRPVSFKLVSSEGTRFIFENKEHDFPQRIIYSLVTTDSIFARIEGISGGKEAGSDFHYKRVSGK